jgi:hypothetical protein
MDESRSLLADEVGDKSNDGRRGAKVSMMVGRSSCDSFRYPGQEYVNEDSKIPWPGVLYIEGEEGWNEMDGDDWEGDWGREGIERPCSR